MPDSQIAINMVRNDNVAAFFRSSGPEKSPQFRA
jgi:hypothetical protein